jgi:4'-phosphopantetheinyl transferase EntD
MMRDATPTAPRLPFVERIAAHEPLRHIVVERTLSLARDLHLADHHFVPARPHKPLAECYPVLPLTFSLEAMAEVAACLAPGMGLTGFDDVGAARWIALADCAELPLRIEARLAHADDAAQCRRLAVTIRAGGDSRPAISATVLFGYQYRRQLQPEFAPLAADAGLDSAAIYASRQMFHGPSLRCLEGEVAVGPRGAAGTLVVRTQDRLFAASPAPQLLTDPALMDGIGQLIGIWAMRQRQRVTFPIGIGRLEYYAATPAPGTRVPLRIETTVLGKLLSTVVEIGDGAGGVWMRIDGWKSWQFLWEPRLLAFRRRPKGYLLSVERPLPAPLAAVDAARPPVWQSMDAAAVADFDRTLLARHYLRRDEMPAFEAKATVPPRQLEWLLGRIAAKDAARRWAAGEGSELLHPVAFAIENDGNGQPRVAHWPLASPPPRLSIAHSQGRALAAAHDGAVGVDVEAITPRDSLCVAAFSDERERRWLPARDGADGDEWLTRLWCAKEVLGKLMGTAVRPSPLAFAAVGRDADDCLLMRHRPDGAGARVAAVRDGAFIYAIGLALPPPP